MRLPVVLVLASVASLTVAVVAVARDTTAPDLHTVARSGAVSCPACHAQHVASWRRTFHRTMTQAASDTSVQGRFDGRTLVSGDIEARFTTREGQRFIDLTLPSGQTQSYRVERTVGSRRIQQYVAKDADHWVRLPLAWNIDEQRWFHLNGAFLDPDGTDYFAHRSLWDGNCIFCHTTGPNPGYDWQRNTFDSHVAELGIACEACHGPGSEHVAKNANPVRRYWLNTTGRADPTIVNPARLTAERSLQVCGHCHGQRVPNPSERIREFLSRGDPFTPGDDLSTFTSPLHRDTVLEGVDVTARFWRDGTPRLTAYEYQALQATADFQRGGLTCGHCHSMHRGDPKGMIEPQLRGPAACTSCHADIAQAPARHSGHEANASDCYGCHLPPMVYGILTVHPTHRIQAPDPSRAWRFDMPEACTLCHLDRTAAWAAQALERQTAGRYRAPQLPTDAGFAVAESIRSLVAGDVVQRVVAASALGRVHAGDRAVDHLWVVPFLLFTLADDSYAAVRHIAYRSLRELLEAARAEAPELLRGAPTAFFDPDAPPAERALVTQAWRAWWASVDKSHLKRPEAVPLDARFELDPPAVNALRAQRFERAVSIGE